ncbi:MAG: phosphate ABC transporter ATP-binding protein [Chloroflexi bacterium]|nr:phosphate ABC transporter ATP-binding protein [Chloroflexota bacterium]
MNEPIYRLQNLEKSYDGRTVLTIDALHIHQGEVFALIGPSGAGKSTLLRLLNFVESPSRGTITFRGIDYGSEEGVPLEVRRRVTTVFQRPMLLNRSVAANVAYGLRLRGIRPNAQQLNRALEQVGLRYLARRRARTLSGGEAQRVALARAIALEPDVLLLDEPTANLDPYNVGLIEDIVLRLNRERGTTIALVTHNVFQARRLAHRVALLLDGKVIEAGPADAFFEAPQDSRAAAFIRGEMVY